MRMFFYTLAQGEDKPGAVLFMNAGVRLPTLDEQIPAHLKALADAGVEILVCGTCSASTASPTSSRWAR